MANAPGNLSIIRAIAPWRAVRAIALNVLRHNGYSLITKAQKIISNDSNIIFIFVV
ncbi:hypothetical protein [Scytonema sp. HK-05]|uniref:hypothetical protein n=1 Tax=Scytonema sp. HK-05 TaxID=1137095 RepID=UPI001301966E|nr:hypothetical protein [Scytonema sp. HK-05]